MKKHLMVTSSAVCLTALFFVTQAGAVDRAAATGALAEVSTVAVIANANLASVAGSGDVDAIAEAKNRADAVDGAVAEAQDAYAAMERAIEGGNMDAADSAAEGINIALTKANNALNGNFAAETPASQRAGDVSINGGPGKAGDVPNIYANPSATATEAGVAQAVFGNFWDTSAFGTRTGFGDREATPE